MHKKVLFVHYRTGERDGVSLEIEKRARVAEELGAEVYYLTGFDGVKRDEAHVIPEMDIMDKGATELRLDLFERGGKSEEEMKKEYDALEAKIKEGILKCIEEVKPDTIFVHNMLALAYNLPASTALLKALDEVKIQTVAVHHDFWFEREKFANPQYDFIEPILNALPPQRDYITEHYVINSLAQKALEKRMKMTAKRIGDYFDYSKELPTADEFNKTLPHDLGLRPHDIVVLQATRIVKRKAIENAIYFAHHLEEYLKANPAAVINNKHWQSDSRVVLLFTNFVEADEEGYVEKLNALAAELGVKMIWAAEHFHNERSQNGKKIYSFWDGYVFADVVTYPSTWEGFGNQFLEAIFFRKLPVVFEYPVFLSDIKHEGYEYVSLGKTVMEKDGLAFVPEHRIKKAAEQAVKILQQKNLLTEMVKTNVVIAQKYHDEELLRQDFRRLLQVDKEGK